MAISDAAAATADWVQFYQQSLGNPTTTQPMFSHSSDSTVVTTVSNSTAAAAAAAASGGIEGRVTKSSRRRSRASRRAPTTLLNTDTTNFRALVQQFTGISSGPYTTGYQPGAAPLISFAGSQQPAPPVSFELMQQQQQQYRIQQQQQQYQLPERFAVGGRNGDGLLEAFGRNPRADVAAAERFFFEGESGEVMPRPSDSW